MWTSGSVRKKCSYFWGINVLIKSCRISPLFCIRSSGKRYKCTVLNWHLPTRSISGSLKRQGGWSWLKGNRSSFSLTDQLLSLKPETRAWIMSCRFWKLEIAPLLSNLERLIKREKHPTKKSLRVCGDGGNYYKKKNSISLWQSTLVAKSILKFSCLEILLADPLCVDYSGI